MYWTAGLIVEYSNKTIFTGAKVDKYRPMEQNRKLAADPHIWRNLIYDKDGAVEQWIKTSYTVLEELAIHMENNETRALIPHSKINLK